MVVPLCDIFLIFLIISRGQKLKNVCRFMTKTVCTCEGSNVHFARFIKLYVRVVADTPLIIHVLIKTSLAQQIR